jgi:hypothetical protein
MSKRFNKWKVDRIDVKGSDSRHQRAIAVWVPFGTNRLYPGILKKLGQIQLVDHIGQQFTDQGLNFGPADEL